MIYLGLDIDETIIKTLSYDGLIDRPDDAEFYFTLSDATYIENFAVYIRPHLKEFMDFAILNFNVFFYTRADINYAKEILKFLKYDNLPLFARDKTIKKEEIIVEAYNQNFKKITYIKDLNIIAKELNISIDDIVFIDDVTSKDQLIQPELTIKIPEFDIDNPDFDLLIIKNHMAQGLLYNQENFKIYMRSLTF